VKQSKPEHLHRHWLSREQLITGLIVTIAGVLLGGLLEHQFEIFTPRRIGLRSRLPRRHCFLRTPSQKTQSLPRRQAVPIVGFTHSPRIELTPFAARRRITTLMIRALLLIGIQRSLSAPRHLGKMGAPSFGSQRPCQASLGESCALPFQARSSPDRHTCGLSFL
jgi:hypothetical protein